MGVEVEARKSLDFLGPEFGAVLLDRRQLHLHRRRGGPHRSRARALGSPSSASPPGRHARYNGLEKSRRLFGQPEWIANADVSFDHPDWGTKVTLAFFAISNVLDAAGSAFILPNGSRARLHARPLRRLLLPARPDR